MSGKTIAKATSVILIFSILSRLLGFVREQVIAAKYGTSIYTDAYVVSLILPNLIYVVIGGAIATTFIPVFTDTSIQKGEKEASLLASLVINLSMAAVLFISLLGILASPWLVSLIAPGFNSQARSLSVELTRIMFPSALFLTLSALAGALLNARKKFAAPAFAPIVFSLSIILSVWYLVPYFGIYGLALGTLLGTVLQFLVQAPFLRRLNLRYQLKLQFSHPGVKKILILMVPALIGTSVNQLYVIIDKILASTLVTGSISALNYANKLTFLPYNLFALAISTVIYPFLSEYAAKKDFAKLGEYAASGISMMWLFTIPASVGLFVLADPLVKLLFERGAFDQTSTAMTVLALKLYLLGLFAQGATQILNRTYFSMQDTKTPVKISLFTVFLNFIFSLILIRYLKHGGLALGTSLAAISNFILVYVSIKRRIDTLPSRNLWEAGGKIALSSAIMGFAVFVFYLFIEKLLPFESIVYQIIKVSAAILVGCAVYTASILLLRIKEAEHLKNLLLRKIS